MKNKPNNTQVNLIMVQWAKEAKTEQVYYKIIKRDVWVYTTRPGVLIGCGGEVINKYKKMIKEAGAHKVNLVEVRKARMPEYNYGMEICPMGDVPDENLCYDYARIGEIACGICGANKVLALKGKEMVMNGIANIDKKNPDKKKKR